MLVVNDCLLKVDDENVYRQSIDRVIKQILGVQNSTISLTLQQFSGDRVVEFATSLRRGKTGTITKTVEKSEEEGDEGTGVTMSTIHRPKKGVR